MSSRPSPFVALAPALLGIALALSKQGEHTVDDAFILFRYAENFASGQGLTFNPGERVEGHSSLAFVLLLAAAHRAGVPCVLASNLLNLLGVGLACAGASLLARELLPETSGGRSRLVAMATMLGAGILVACSDGIVNWGLLGLETAFAAGLTATALARRAIEERTGRSPWLSGALFGILGITRPEAPMSYLLAAIGGASRGTWRRELRRAILAVGMPALQLAFRIGYYGELLPNTFHAKIWSGAERYARGAAYVLEGIVGSGEAGWAWRLPLLVGGIVGLAALRSRTRVAPVLAVALGGIAFAVYSGGDYYTSHRFLVPTLPALFALLASGIGGLATGIPGGAALVAGTVIATVLLAPGFGSWRAYASLPGSLPRLIAANVASLDTPSETVQVRVGRFLGRSLPPDATLTVGDCGRIPYFSRLRVVDSLGLMDPVVARSPGKVNEKLAADYLLGRDTDYVLLRHVPLDRYPRTGGLRIDHLLLHHPGLHATRRLVAWFPFGPTALFLLQKERDVVDLSAEIARGAAALDGGARVGIVEPTPSPELVDRLSRTLARHPFELLPDGDVARLYRTLWPTSAVELPTGGSLRYRVALPGSLELGLSSGASITVRQGAEARRIDGAASLLAIHLVPGELWIQARRPSAILGPRIRTGSPGVTR